MFFDIQRLPGTCDYWEFQSTRMLARLPSALRGAKLPTRRLSCAKNHSHQFRDLGLELGFDLARVLVRQCAVAAGVGVDLGAVERDGAHL